MIRKFVEITCKLKKLSVGVASYHFQFGKARQLQQDSKSNVFVHFKLDETTRCFVRQKPFALDPKSDGISDGNIECYKLVHIKHMEVLMMFTDSPQIWTYDLIDSEWNEFEDVILPRIPGPDLGMNVVIGFNGIVFLFYYSSSDSKEDSMNSLESRVIQRKPSEDSDGETDVDEDSDENEEEEQEEEETFSYCWDLLFTGEIFECDSAYGGGGQCIAVNTEENWTHFVGEKWKKPYHFKIELAEEIPMELTITHLYITKNVIKQFCRESMGKKVANNIELQILEFFPMFL